MERTKEVITEKQIFIPGLTEGELNIDGAILCAICGLSLNQNAVNAGKVLAMIGVRAYVACMTHFYWTNPATGELTEVAEFDENIKMLGLQYAIGEALPKKSCLPKKSVKGNVTYGK